MTKLRFTPWRYLTSLFLALCMLALPLTASADFYDQPILTEAELLKFIDDMPNYLQWARQNKEQSHPSLDKQGRPSFSYSAKAATKVTELGWKAERFFCVMGRTAAALALGGHKPGLDKPVDMPMISPKELTLVRRHMDKLDAIGK